MLFLTFPLAICKFYLTVLTWNLVSNLYYRLWRSYVNNENLSFNKYDVLSFIFFVYTYTLGFYSFIHIQFKGRNVSWRNFCKFKIFKIFGNRPSKMLSLSKKIVNFLKFRRNLSYNHWRNLIMDIWVIM